MGTKERRERERHDTRELILSAAREMFASEGFEAVTMRAIADRIEYTPTALYHHFPSKQALVAELCERDFMTLAKIFYSAAEIADPVERMYAIGRTYLSFAEEHPSQYRFMFMTVLPPMEHEPGYLDRAKRSPEHNAYLFLRDACQAAIDAGRLRPEYSDADLIAQIMWSTIHGLVSLRIVKQHDEWIPWRDLRESAESAMRSHMQGMLASR